MKKKKMKSLFEQLNFSKNKKRKGYLINFLLLRKKKNS